MHATHNLSHIFAAIVAENEITIKRAQEIAHTKEKLDLLEKEKGSVTRKLTVEANGILLQNATMVVRTLVENTEVRVRLEEMVFGQKKKYAFGDHALYAVLATKPPEQNEPHRTYAAQEIPIGGSREPFYSYRIALSVPWVESRLLWEKAEISYCEDVRTGSSSNMAPCFIQPDFDDPELVRALLHLQTPVTALRYIIDKYINNKESHD